MNIKNEILPAVAAIIFNEQGELLLQHRKDVLKWGLISGHVEFGETVADAILREIKEETNTAAVIVRLIGIYSAPSFQTYHYTERSVQYVTTYFEARLVEPLQLTFTNNETAALQFFSPQQLPSELALIHPNWLQDALSMQAIPFLR